MKCKRIICIALALAMCVSMSVANAATYVESYKRVEPTEDHMKFKSKWSEKHEPEWTMYVNGVPVKVGAILTIGYDTWWTNEDYVKNVGGSPTGAYAQGRIFNDNGWEYTDKVYGARIGTDKADIKHTTTNLRYGVIVGWPKE